jgi:short-subunit dehydrogenase
MGQFSDQTVWITGASSGIGRALARAMADEGARLILSGRNAAALAEVAADCPQSEVIAFDVTDLDALPAVVARAEAVSGQIDMLVNNAGVAQRSLVRDSEFQLYRTIMEIDYFAPLRLTQLVLPAMLARGSGHIVAVASLSGRFGNPTASAYCGAKFAMIGFFEALRSEVAHAGLKVTVITPGFIKTAIAGHALDGSGKPISPGAIGERGITAEACAVDILAGLAAGKREIAVGQGPEMAALELVRSNPEQLFDMMAGLGQAMASGKL